MGDSDSITRSSCGRVTLDSLNRVVAGVPRLDVVRRFSRGWDNFQGIYRPLADSWAVYDNSDREPRLMEKSP
jgi:predicted ABC-type ATPase